MNAPDRMDAFRVPEGMAPITATMDEKVKNAYTFKFARQDHTLGNMLRMELLRDPRVKFCGYKHPHPLDNDILLRVQTAPGVAPAQSLVGAATRLRLESTLIKNKFDDEMRRIAEEKARLHDDY